MYFHKYNADENQGVKQYLLDQLNGTVGKEYSPKRLKRKQSHREYTVLLPVSYIVVMWY